MKRSGFRSIGSFVVVLILSALGASQTVFAQSDGPPGVFLQVIPHDDLNFGTVVQREGSVTKFATDEAVGKFEVWAQLPPNKEVTITIEPPEHLSNDSEEVPYQLRASYNAHSDDPASATEISGLSATFTPRADETYDYPPPPFPEARAYIYVYGTATVEDHPSGTYRGPITLKAEMTN